MPQKIQFKEANKMTKRLEKKIERKQNKTGDFVLLEENELINSDEINFLDLIDWNQFKQTTRIKK